jgi:hypothetical protein
MWISHSIQSTGHLELTKMRDEGVKIAWEVPTLRRLDAADARHNSYHPPHFGWGGGWWWWWWGPKPPCNGGGGDNQTGS